MCVRPGTAVPCSQGTLASRGESVQWDIEMPETVGENFRRVYVRDSIAHDRARIQSACEFREMAVQLLREAIVGANSSHHA